jgi:hypothetical protein
MDACDKGAGSCIGSDKEEILHFAPESQSSTLSPQPRASKDGTMQRHQLISVFTVLAVFLLTWRPETA